MINITTYEPSNSRQKNMSVHPKLTPTAQAKDPLINKLRHARTGMQNCPEIWSFTSNLCPVNSLAVLDSYNCDSEVSLTFSEMKVSRSNTMPIVLFQEFSRQLSTADYRSHRTLTNSNATTHPILPRRRPHVPGHRPQVCAHLQGARVYPRDERRRHRGKLGRMAPGGPRDPASGGRKRRQGCGRSS